MTTGKCGRKVRCLSYLLVTPILLFIFILYMGCNMQPKSEAEDNQLSLSTEKKYSNRLKDQQSPYLLQHANNPVDWYPWGEEAFERAKKENKPVFLSIGYSTCHWCHVMEHESFENEEIA